MLVSSGVPYWCFVQSISGIDEVEVNVYEPSSFSSDSVDEYTLTYEELDKDVLEEILFICGHYEAEQIQTEKRISN